MAQTFLLPDLGEGLTEAAIVAWHVEVGDTVAVDQVIAEVETAKSIVELPSPFAGTIIARHGEAGAVVNVGSPFIEVGAAGESAGGSAPSDEQTVTVPDDARELENYRAEERAGSGSGNVLIGYGTSSHGGAPQRRRARSGGVATVPASVAAPAAPAATVAEAPASAPAKRTGPVPVQSPIVRRLARDLGLDVRALVGTGTDGMVTRRDVLSAANAAETASQAAPMATTALSGSVTIASSASAPPAALAEAKREPMSILRRTVSAKMSTSRQEIPEATVWVDVDITDLWAYRAKMAAPDSPAPSFTALAAKFVLLALAEYPLLASRIDGNDIVTFDGVNLGVAADTDRGLMVPVIPRADALSVTALDASLREVAGEARTGRLAPDRMTGSTITLNNYGALGVDGSAAIINHPEVAIVGFGRAIERPWVVNGEIVARRIVQLSLVFDHRVCDGGYAAGFIRHLVTSLENPLSRFAQL